MRFSPLSCARDFLLVKGSLLKEVLLYRSPNWSPLMHKMENHMFVWQKIQKQKL